jgi:nitrogen-specific signal transduction histidine kinase
MFYPQGNRLRPGYRTRINSLDVIWLFFLAGLAVLPPLWEIHKQVTLLAIGVLQLFENRIVARYPRHGTTYAVVLKLVLATLLIAHTGGPGINSSYYPIYYVPVITAAVYFGPIGTMLWTLLAAALYCSFLYPALQEYQLTVGAAGELATRILFFFLAGLVVNRFVLENKKQTKLYQQVAEQLSESNRQLQRAQAEARRSERLAALGQLSAGLAHEIRNPLGVIKGSAEMLSKKLANSDAVSAELAGYVSTEVNRLSSLVSRFLDFARPLRIEARRQDLTAVLDRALRTVAENWKGGPVVVERDYAADLPPVPLDDGLCEQAFINLVQNAYEAMGAAGGTLRVRVSHAHANGHNGIEVRFQDTGPGVPAGMREQIFNPFVTTKDTGVGLGLSIVSKIVDEHHGVIRLESTPGEGACFVLFFPAEEECVPLEGAVVAG